MLFRSASGRDADAQRLAAALLARALPELLWLDDVPWATPDPTAEPSEGPFDLLYPHVFFERFGLWPTPALSNPPPGWDATTMRFIALMPAITSGQPAIALGIPLLAAWLAGGQGAPVAKQLLDHHLQVIETPEGAAIPFSQDLALMVGKLPYRDATRVLATIRGQVEPWSRPEGQITRGLNAICPRQRHRSGRRGSTTITGLLSDEHLANPARIELIATALHDPMRFTREAFDRLEPGRACDVVGSLLAGIAGVIPACNREVDGVLDLLSAFESKLGTDDLSVMRVAKMYIASSTDRFVPVAREAIATLRQAGTIAVRLASSDQGSLARIAPLVSSRPEHVYALAEEAGVHNPEAARMLAGELAGTATPEGGTFTRR